MNYKEIEVGKITDMNIGEMKNIKVKDDEEILLVRTKDKYYALAPNCTHYGAPLKDGVLSGESLVCPWHHACFSVKSGKVLEPPALDSLPQYEIIVDTDILKIKVPEELDERKIPEMTKQSGADNRQFVILGAGVAGYSAAQSLRENGFSGKVIMLTGEEDAPYDRPNLSKNYLQGEAEEEWMPLRPENFYTENDIELKLSSRVKNIDLETQNIELENDNEISYDKLLIATGGTPRKLVVNGSDLKNIFYLRSFQDARKIIPAAEKAKSAVVIGSSFIGMETAFSLKKRGLNVSVISKDDIPFKSKFGEEIGKMFLKEHEDNGIKFYLETGVKEFAGSGKIEKIITEDGTEIEADLVIVGIGVKPATDFIAGIDLNDDGSFSVDEKFYAGNNIFAAGDVAKFPDWRTGEKTRIEHFRTAEQQGRIAGMVMAGKEIEFSSIPFFWTNQFDLKFRYVGQAKEWDEIYFDGDVQEKEFAAYFIKDDKVLAVAGVNKDKELAAAQALMREARFPNPDQVKNSESLMKFI